MLILKKKWLRDKAKRILKIVDSPLTSYDCWDVISAARDTYPHFSHATIAAIENEVCEIGYRAQQVSQSNKEAS